jgi:LacI family transcriptional regulator
MALRDDCRVAPATKEKIKRIAAELGYRPDPALSALAAYRLRNRRGQDRGKIAVLNTWKEIPNFFREEVGAARERAEQLGYDSELFFVPPSRQEQASLSRMLVARGIRGILVGPVPRDRSELYLDWRQFAATTIGYSLREPALNYSACNHIHAIETTYRELRARGYSRIGFCNKKSAEERNQHFFVCGYLRCLFADQLTQNDRPLLISDNVTAADFLDWIRTSNFDVVISHPFPWLKSLWYSEESIPADVATLRHYDTVFSGVTEDRKDIGVTAINLLHNMLITGERGIPEHRISILVDGVWEDRGTVRDRPSISEPARKA